MKRSCLILFLILSLITKLVKADSTDTCANKDGIDYQKVGTEKHEKELEQAKSRVRDFSNVQS